MPRRTQVPREVAAAWGREAAAIIGRGSYVVAGRAVSIAEAIEASQRRVSTYPAGTDPAHRPRRAHRTALSVRNDTTLAAAQGLLARGRNPVALNFASATHPGGGFLTGARAQEESLAWSSGLVATLEGNPMYEFHRRQNDPLYSDYLIYSPDVPVFRGEDGALLPAPWLLSFLTAAAPLARIMPPDRRPEIEPAMRRRIRKVLLAGLAHGHDAIVLGAWGCGAFGNDGELVAGLFREALLGEFDGGYAEVEFAVLDWSADEHFIGPFRRALR